MLPGLCFSGPSTDSADTAADFAGATLCAVLCITIELCSSFTCCTILASLFCAGQLTVMSLSACLYSSAVVNSPCQLPQPKPTVVMFAPAALQAELQPAMLPWMMMQKHWQGECTLQHLETLSCTALHACQLCVSIAALMKLCCHCRHGVNAAAMEDGAITGAGVQGQAP